MFGKKNTFKVPVQIVPVSGRPNTETVDIPKTGASLKEVLKTAGVDPSKKKLLVDGNPADLNTHVTASSKVTVSEQPQGS